jgi:hypothetical protein
MMKVKFVYDAGSDWVELYVDGKLAMQDHGLDPARVAGFLLRYAGVDVEIHEAWVGTPVTFIGGSQTVVAEPGSTVRQVTQVVSVNQTADVVEGTMIGAVVGIERGKK